MARRRQNFWEGFKEVLGKGHVIKGLDKCDFTPIYDWHIAQRDAKKNISKEVRAGRGHGAGAIEAGQGWLRAVGKDRKKHTRPGARCPVHAGGMLSCFGSKYCFATP